MLAGRYLMQLVDQGTLSLDDRLPALVDTFLGRLNHGLSNQTSLLKLWGGDKTIEQVSLGDVMHMKSGQ